MSKIIINLLQHTGLPLQHRSPEAIFLEQPSKYCSSKSFKDNTVVLDTLVTQSGSTPPLSGYEKSKLDEDKKLRTVSVHGPRLSSAWTPKSNLNARKYGNLSGTGYRLVLNRQKGAAISSTKLNIMLCPAVVAKSFG
ncbi:hypothetical protein Tco_1175008 [Tanacetum coccineum]